MSLEEYFKDWLKVIDVKELNNAVFRINQIKAKVPIVPDYTNIFKAFTLCSKHDCKIVFLGQDFNRLPISNLIYLLHI